MASEFNRLVIVGGGTAGWLSACLLAARRPELDVTLVEAPDIPTIGVGEGSWPTLRDTLATIGIEEAVFLETCDASFKQGSRFDGWVDGSASDSYYHPFTPPIPGSMADLLSAWSAGSGSMSFAEAVSPQAAVCDRDLAPRQRAMPPYAGALNYGYHLDAGKLVGLLADHATTQLGVTHIRDQVTDIERGDDGLLTRLVLRDGTTLNGDFFIDCTGMAARLIGGELGVGWVDRSDVSFNDRALAVQVPVEPGSAIASQTIGTAHRAGWLWDIALPTRRGIGCVYSSQFLGDEAATQILSDYVATAVPGTEVASLAPRRLQFETGHREKFWEGNCLAVGLSAGFIEPLEASAIVLIELSLKALADGYPHSRAALPQLADRFNTLFRYRWDRIVDFLKLHYVLSRREEPYWRAQRDPATIPASLAGQLALWRDHPPLPADFPQVDEIFSAASQQYVLYGMGFPLPAEARGLATEGSLRRLAEVGERSRALAAALPSNRTYLAASTASAQSCAAQEETA
ncbi:tryptophan halogenase family protein [Tritonibacter scottomollicae]|uniref:tryptophan halogenase family protein n=1 Tax=Tritonibacter scottomollicae TaxID=483013 RepID=UPI003AA853C0